LTIGNHGLWDLLMDDLTGFCCQNPECPDYGLRGHDNLRVAFRYGKRRRRMLACRTCRRRFSELTGTALFGTRLPHDQALAVFQHLQDGCGVRQTARLTGVDKDTVVRYALRAGNHARQAHDELVAFSPSDPGSATG
jgi:transposase-like protein